MQERIELGRRLLAELAHVDFGYDLQQWHDHLKHSRDGGYTWHKSVALPKIMRDALASPEWNEAVASLSESDASVPRGLGRR